MPVRSLNLTPRPERTPDTQYPASNTHDFGLTGVTVVDVGQVPEPGSLALL